MPPGNVTGMTDDESGAPRGLGRVTRSRLGSPDARRSRLRGFSFVRPLRGGGGPETVAAFRRLLPLDSQIIHVRWSGEGGWIPMGDLDVGIGPENATSYPSPAS